MADLCSEVAKITRDIRNMLRESDKVKAHEELSPSTGKKTTYHDKLNQTAALDGSKVTDIKESVGEYRRTPQGKAVIYTKVTDSLEPDSRDVEEIIEHKRPFICRAVRMFAKDTVACYAPADNIFRFIKANLESIEESEKELKEVIRKKYAAWNLTAPQSKSEKALMKLIRSRRTQLSNILDTKPMERAYDEYTREIITLVPERPGLASKALNKCSFNLK